MNERDIGTVAFYDLKTKQIISTVSPLEMYPGIYQERNRIYHEATGSTLGTARAAKWLSWVPQWAYHKVVWVAISTHKPVKLKR